MFDSYPDHLWSRDEVLSSACPVPPVSGLYFWWFRRVPEIIPQENCVTFRGMTLLYIGISPDKRGKPNSKANLKTRVKAHYSGNAEGSTLRKTLGVILSSESHYPLRRVGSGKRLTFTHTGEQWLDNWMQNNAFVSWVENDMPWLEEERLLHTLSLPLNLQGNSHPFKATLSAMRTRATRQAKEMDIADETGTRRRLFYPDAG